MSYNDSIFMNHHIKSLEATLLVNTNCILTMSGILIEKYDCIFDIPMTVNS